MEPAHDLIAEFASVLPRFELTFPGTGVSHLIKFKLPGRVCLSTEVILTALNPNSWAMFEKSGGKKWEQIIYCQAVSKNNRIVP